MQCWSAAQEVQQVLRGKMQGILAFLISSSAAQQYRRGILHPFVHTASQGATWSDLTPWSVLQHHWCRLAAITAVRSAQSTKINPKHFLRDSDYLNYFNCLSTNRPTLVLFIVLTSQSSTANLKWSLYLFLFCSFLGRRPLETHFYPLMFIKESFLGKDMCLHVTNERKSDYASCILSFHAPIQIWSTWHFRLNYSFFS